MAFDANHFDIHDHPVLRVPGEIWSHPSAMRAKSMVPDPVARYNVSWWKACSKDH